MSQIKDSRLFRSDAYIGGSWVAASSGKSFEVENPADRSVLGSVADLEISQVREAIDAADAAWPAWRAKTAKERATLLIRWYDLMLENDGEGYLCVPAETGSPGAVLAFFRASDLAYLGHSPLPGDPAFAPLCAIDCADCRDPATP